MSELTLASLREAGAHQHDPARFHYLEVLERRLASQPDAVRHRLTQRLKVAVQDYAQRVAHAAAPEGRGAGGVPFSFLQAAGFQWVNPKAWAMSLGAVSAYAGDGGLAAIGTITVVFACVNLPSVALWAAMGEALRHWLQSPTRLRAFNWTMAALLVASLIPVLRM